MTQLAFEKIHACGNDFILLTSVPTAELIPGICDRNHGLGADGVMFWEIEGESLVLGHLDPDGSRSLCLNGTRASLHCLGQQGKIPQRGEVISEGHHFGYVLSEGQVQLTLPMRPFSALDWRQGSWQVAGHFCDVGNPHYVLVGSLTPELFEEVAPSIRWDLDHFPQGTNVHLIWVELGRHRIRSYERGVEGFTLACGSGMYAAALVCLQGKPGEIKFWPDGQGHVIFRSDGVSIEMVGEAHWVASGVYRC